MLLLMDPTKGKPSTSIRIVESMDRKKDRALSYADLQRKRRDDALRQQKASRASTMRAHRTLEDGMRQVQVRQCNLSFKKTLSGSFTHLYAGVRGSFPRLGIPFHRPACQHGLGVSATHAWETEQGLQCVPRPQVLLCFSIHATRMDD